MFTYIGNFGISSVCVISGYFWIDSNVDPLFSCVVIYLI